MKRVIWGSPVYGWILFILWLAGIALGIGWKNFLFEFGFRAAFISSIFGGVWVVEKINLWRSAGPRRER